METATQNERITIFENPPEITDSESLAIVNKTWHQSNPYPGPIQIKRIEKHLRECRWNAKAIGSGDGGTFTVSLYGKQLYSPSPIAVLKEIGEKYGWSFTKSNASKIDKEFKESYHQINTFAKKVGRPETDEELAERIEGYERATARHEKNESNKILEAKTVAQILTKRPPAATALIVANLVKDTGDIMTDYHASIVTDQVAIGWRSGQREDFAALRKAAATFPQTAHLGPQANASVEHKDNYSMGGGNYVALGYQHSSGWQIKSIPLNADGDGFGYGIKAFITDETPEAPEPTEGGEASEGENFYIVQQYHDKRACDIWTVVIQVRTERDTFLNNKVKASANNGWYYRKFRGNEGGFHFASLEDANNFATVLEID